MKELPRTIASDQVSAVARAVTCRELQALLDLRYEHLVKEVGDAVVSPDTAEPRIQELINEARNEARAILYGKRYLELLSDAVSTSITTE